MGFETSKAHWAGKGETLWDIPMGFETHLDEKAQSRQTILWDIPMGFETLHFHTKCQYSHIMRHPYGIWNFAEWSNTDCWPDYETSLWDLKRTAREVKASLKTHYETSLWDLKRTNSTTSTTKMLILWDIPMGFETFGCFAPTQWTPTLWDIPMGFETIIKSGTI